MAASVARVVQAVRPHVALIKFPSRITGAAGHETSKAPSGHSSSSSSTQGIVSTALPSSTLAPSYQGQIGTSKRGTGIDFHLLPERLKRKPLDQAEIEYINRGGPE